MQPSLHVMLQVAAFEDLTAPSETCIHGLKPCPDSATGVTMLEEVMHNETRDRRLHVGSNRAMASKLHQHL
jgi:hypothetical protein